MAVLNATAPLQVQDVWADISPLNPMATERVGYPTQKPEALLARIIEASTDPGAGPRLRVRQRYHGCCRRAARQAVDRR